MDAYLLQKGDCRELLVQLSDNSVDLCVTDPPYFIDGMCNEWDAAKLEASAAKAGVIGALPVGMKFDPQQGRKFQEFMFEVSEHVRRVLKPGGFYITFSQARLVHRLGVAVEDADFEVRDLLGWVYEGQAKAFSQDHFVRKMKKTDEEKAALIKSLGGRKTPQLKPMIEPMILGQKPKDGTFIENWQKWGVGLVDTSQTLDGKFPGNLMAVPKPNKEEKGDMNEHLTVKPVKLISHLIKLFSTEGQVVLDPFTGSGSHGVAAIETGRKFIGFEIEQKYFDIAQSRMVNAKYKPTQDKQKEDFALL